MYRKIIVGYDGSDQANDALAFGKLLADTSGAELSLGTVFTFNLPLRGGFTPVSSEVESDIEQQLEEAAVSVGATAKAVRSSSPPRGLHELAEETGADLIVVGSARHGRVGQTLLGSVGVALMHGSPCAVAIAPRGYAEQPDRDISGIVVGYDGSAESGLALEEARELARASGAPLRLVAAAEPPSIALAATGGASYRWQGIREALEDEMRQRLDHACASVPDVHVEATLVSSAPAEAVAEAASAPGSILLLGSRGYGPLRRVLLGSVSRELASSAPAPLIVHPRGMHEKPTTAPTAEAATAP